MEQYQKLIKPRHPRATQTLQQLICTSSSFMADCSVHYQPSQTGLNLLFPLAHAHRSSVNLDVRQGIHRGLVSARWLAGWLAGWTAYCTEAKLLQADLGLLCVWGDFKLFKSVAADYSCVPMSDLGILSCGTDAKLNQQINKSHLDGMEVGTEPRSSFLSLGSWAAAERRGRGEL